MTLLQQFILPRLLQWVIVIVVGITITFLIPRLSPVNPIQQALGRLTQFATLEPEAVLQLREQLMANYGLEGSVFEQYVRFWGNLLGGDLGPSFGAFPQRVNDMIGRALPYTVALLTFTTILGWIIGIIVGTLAAYYPGPPNQPGCGRDDCGLSGTLFHYRLHFFDGLYLLHTLFPAYRSLSR